MPRRGPSPIELAIAVLVASVLYAATAAAASADWFVEGSELSGTAALATKATVDEAFKLKAAGVTVECAGGTLNGTSPEIKLPSTVAATSLTLSECKASEHCTLATKTIGTLALLAEVSTILYPEAKATFLPKQSKFAAVHFEGAECALAGVQSLTGKATALLLSGEVESKQQEIKLKTTEASKELKLGSSAAELTGLTLLSLASEKEWAFVQPGMPQIRLARVAGNGNANNHKQCNFTIKNETCELSLTVNRIINNVKLKFVADRFMALRGSLEFEMTTGAQNPECQKGAFVGGTNGGVVGSVCYIRLRYVGPNNPGQHQFVAAYWAEVQENIVAGQLRADEVFLDAQE
jgi:hypothetical protein